jgi:hypothetical protein
VSHDVLYYGVCKCGEKRKGDQLEGCTHIQSDEKIALVLDLTPWYISVSTESIEQMYDVKSDEFHAMVRTSKDLYHNKAVQSWIKVRPGTREMLRDLKNTYKIYIYTMGTRPYAEEVKKILIRRRYLWEPGLESMRYTRLPFQAVVETQASR